MVIWRLQSSKYTLINSEGAKLTGGRWNRPGTAVIYASQDIVLTALEVIVHHGGIPEDYVGIKIDIPDDLEIGTSTFQTGGRMWVPEEVTAGQGTKWANTCQQAVLRVPWATMSVPATTTFSIQRITISLGSPSVSTRSDSIHG